MEETMLIHPIKIPNIDKELLAGRLAQACFFLALGIVFIIDFLFFEFPEAVKKLGRA